MASVHDRRGSGGAGGALSQPHLGGAVEERATDKKVGGPGDEE